MAESGMQTKFEFHVSKESRDLYQFDRSLFSFDGNVILANFIAAREFAQKMNEKRDLTRYPDAAVRASEINAMGLIDEVLHALLEYYRQEINPNVIEKALIFLQNQIGQDDLQNVLSEFINQFPPLRVYLGEESVEEYLADSVDGYPNLFAAVEELLMLWLANSNPAFKKYDELFNDQKLRAQTKYEEIFPLLKEFFETQPKLEDLNLIDALEEPAKNNPDSLSGQLEFLLRKWRSQLGSRFWLRILGSLDFIKEETKIVFGTGGGGEAQVPVFEFGSTWDEPEKFSPDRDWMPSAVMIAKNVYVWLDQLSKKYQRSITRLDEIPEEEIDYLKRLGFNSLWLIGLWERSSASKRIKQLCGNPEAVASAYSLYDYAIADDLGGDSAYEHLRNRAWERGIRLAADMVPNHVGVYSKWVVEHPDWFISLDYSPFPGYSFTGPDLSEDERVGIFIEDRYYSREDAAVVFKRVDRWTGSEKYIYHGNDGTSMPWNDTAQLNYLLPEVREAVIQTILHVARKFRIIRFDAAMTLAKKHYQRLWFPEPGTGGDIPSRAEFGLTKQQFDQAMPEEFWREVVDRVAEEVPDTLLLAEAFWLMEGYFVRTLGMHRVYNSAFMNMLRDEKNAEYRLVIKNTLEFDPEILKRYVNFMNNPDERTAVDQFGKGDKYFGVAMMMSTMPGLPMFGHGQIEGYTEKYGMEYRKAYWDEEPDQDLVERHLKEIAPILDRRYMFAGVDHFLLFDFYTEQGNVNEDVFAYSNEAFGQKSLFVYHNRFADTRGWIKTSSAFAVKSDDGNGKKLVQMTLAEGFGITADHQRFTIFRDVRNGLEYIRNNREIVENGLFLGLNAYEYHVFVDFREVIENEWNHYHQLENSLAGEGVPNIEEALKELFLRSIHQPFRELINAGQLDWIIENTIREENGENNTQKIQLVLSEVEIKLRSLYEAVQEYTNSSADFEPIINTSIVQLETLMRYFSKNDEIDFPQKMPKYFKQGIGDIQEGLRITDYAGWPVLIIWSLIHELGYIYPEGVSKDPKTAVDLSHQWLDEWLLTKIIREALRDMGYDDNAIYRSVELISILINEQSWFKGIEAGTGMNQIDYLEEILSDEQIRNFLGINLYQGVLYFNAESFNTLIWGLESITGLQLIPAALTETKVRKDLRRAWDVLGEIKKAELASDYEVEKLLQAVES